MTRHSLRFAPAAALAGILCAASLFAQPSPKWPSSSAPRPLAAREVAFPSYVLESLPNGFRFVVVRHAEQPVVSLRLLVRAGSAQDPSDRTGLAAMVATLLDQGTTTRSARQVADTIDSVGGQLETGAGRDMSFAHVVVMRDSLAVGVGLLADVVRRPALAQQELERQRDQAMASLRVSYEDPDYVATAVFDRLVYGAHPYGSPDGGTPESLQRLTRDDLVRFHDRYFVPNNCILAVVGDVTAEEATAEVTAAFGDWARREVPVDPVVDVPPAARRVVVVDKPDAVQTEIRMGEIGIPRNSADFMAVDLAMRILGGEGANRLHRVLRTEHALTYGASADSDTFARSGEFVAETNTRSEATGEVLRLMTGEFSKLRKDRVGDRELADAKAYLTGNFPLTIETPDDIATQILDVLFYGLPLDDLQTFRRRVEAVSVDDIARVSGRYVRPEQLSVALVGNASAFVGQLARAGFDHVEVIRLADLDLTAADFRKKDMVVPARASRGGGRWPAGLPAFPAVIPAAPSYGQRRAAISTTDAAASAVVDRAIAARGGLEKLRALRTLVATAKTTFDSPEGPLTSETTTWIEYPDRVRVEARLPIGSVVQVYAGGDAVWVQDPERGVMEPPAAVRRDFRDSARRDVVQLLLRAHAGELHARMVCNWQTAGAESRDVEVIELSGDKDLGPIQLSVDRATGMVAGESYALPGEGGTVEETFGDYRDVDGIKVPFTGSLRRGDMPAIERVVTRVRVNEAIDQSLFRKPAK